MEKPVKWYSKVLLTVYALVILRALIWGDYVEALCWIAIGGTYMVLGILIDVQDTLNQHTRREGESDL